MTTPMPTKSKTTGTMTRRGAGGKLSIAFFDERVPSGNAVMQKQVEAWPARNQAGFKANNNAELVRPIDDVMTREPVEARCDEVIGCDVPPFDTMLGFAVREAVKPPNGTIYCDPIRPLHGAKPPIPAVPEPAARIFDRGTLPARLKSGDLIAKVIAWTNDELEGLARLPDRGPSRR